MSRASVLPVTAFVSALVALTAAGPGAARADEGVDGPAGTPAPEAVFSAKPDRARRPRLEWDPSWSRFRWWEYAGTAGVYVADWYVRYHEPPPDRASWEGNNAFDDTIRGWLRSSSYGTRHTAGKVSDWTVLVGSVYPFAVDLPVVAVVHRNPDVMWQMLMMNLEANAVAGVINNSLFHFAGRARPNTQECNADPRYDPLCGAPGDNASFPSGHVLTIATAAGLTCAHHQYLPIYGSDAADAGACAMLLGATAVTGVARVVADRHFATDVLAGGLIGFGSGYGLPLLLHYRAGDTGPRTAILPMAGPEVLGLSVIGLSPL